MTTNPNGFLWRSCAWTGCFADNFIINTGMIINMDSLSICLLIFDWMWKEIEGDTAFSPGINATKQRICEINNKENLFELLCDECDHEEREQILSEMKVLQDKFFLATDVATAVDKLIVESLKNEQTETLEHLVESILTSLSNLVENDYFILPSGWMTRVSGHAICKSSIFVCFFEHHLAFNILFIPKFNQVM